MKVTGTYINFLDQLIMFEHLNESNKRVHKDLHEVNNNIAFQLNLY